LELTEGDTRREKGGPDSVAYSEYALSLYRRTGTVYSYPFET
jgi:hypothetical protein